ncbi:MAG: methyl-accepting chemotaxis protein [Candidatus Methylacidiphilales bacterium]
MTTEPSAHLAIPDQDALPPQPQLQPLPEGEEPVQSHPHKPTATLRKPTRSTIGKQLSTAFSIIGLLATLAMAATAYFSAESAMKVASFDQLSSVRVLLKDSVENYFSQVRNDLASQAQSMTVITALQQFTEARRALAQDMASQSFVIDDTNMKPVKEKLRGYYTNVLIANLNKVNFSAGTAESYIIRGNDAQLLQYIFTVANPAAVGSKDESSMSTYIRSYADADPGLLLAFAGTKYVAAHDRFHPQFQDLRRRQGYYDIFLVDTDGNVVYTNMKELDFQGNLKEGPVADTGLGQAYRAAMSTTLATPVLERQRITDMAPYTRSYNAPAMFIASPVYDGGGKALGALIFQLPVDRINKLTTFQGREQEIKLGNTGEAYLVGQDMKQRTNSRFLTSLKDGTQRIHTMQADGLRTTETTIGVLDVSTDAARSALAGNIGQQAYANYRGSQVLGSWAPLVIPIQSTSGKGPLNWAILVEKERQEAYSPVTDVLLNVIIAGAVVVALVLMGSYLVSDRLAAPIVSLQSTMQRVAKGEENLRAEVLSSNEIGELATTFNELVTERNAAKNKIVEENKRLQANIQDLLMVVADASDGNLGIRAKVTEGALGNMADALNLMLENVGELMANAKKASARVAEASRSISSASRELADGAMQQSNKIIQTTDGAKALNAESARVLEVCREAGQAAREAQESAERGAAAVRGVMTGMAKIRENTQGNARKIKRLGERSMEISGIVRSISDISAQTDMLALNASIEAARAGEQGKGFTVVADQVRALAERTKAATLEIERLVLGIQSETSEAVSQMEAQTQEVEAGSGKVEQAGSALEDIVESSTQSSRLVAQISQSATQQATRVEEMLRTVASVQDITKASQIKVLETRKSSEQMATLSQELTKELAQFNLD